MLPGKEDSRETLALTPTMAPSAAGWNAGREEKVLGFFKSGAKLESTRTAVCTKGTHTTVPHTTTADSKSTTILWQPKAVTSDPMVVVTGSCGPIACVKKSYLRTCNPVVPMPSVPLPAGVPIRDSVTSLKC